MMAATTLTTYGLSVCHIVRCSLTPAASTFGDRQLTRSPPSPQDDRAETTKAGRADGIQPRTIEVLRNLGAAKQKDAGEDEEGRAGLAKRLIAQGVRCVLPLLYP